MIIINYVQENALIWERYSYKDIIAVMLWNEEFRSFNKTRRNWEALNLTLHYTEKCSNFQQKNV